MLLVVTYFLALHKKTIKYKKDKKYIFRRKQKKNNSSEKRMSKCPTNDNKIG